MVTFLEIVSKVFMYAPVPLKQVIEIELHLYRKGWKKNPRNKTQIWKITVHIWKAEEFFVASSHIL